MFYGLFLRGHSAEALRRDVDVPRLALDKWLRKRVYSCRKQVLAIFDELVLNDRIRPRIQ